MKRIGVVSDSHGDCGHLQQALMKLEADGRIDALIHCGDGGFDAKYLTGNIMQTVIVRGNCDGWTSPFEEEMIVPIGNVRFMVTHGHRYGVKRDLSVLADSAAAKGVQVVCFGHTHVPYCEWHNGVLLLNPGSCAYTGRCALITVSDNCDVRAQLL